MAETGGTDPATSRPQGAPRASLRSHRIAWVWVVPLTAIAIVLWLAWSSLADRGAEIRIVFRSVEGLQAGQSKIQHRNVDVGTVESLELTSDMSRVVVKARMTREATEHLTADTRFAIIEPHVGVGGISGLSTIVSGSYIEMYPGKSGAPQRSFVGLDAPPLMPPDTPGRAFTLVAGDLGSLTRGSPISYHGVSVGEVQDYSLRADGEGVTVTAFIRAPHDRLVHPETRFWNAGGVDLSVGTQGIRFRANSWEQLLSGGIAFETPKRVLGATPSPPATVFSLYDNQRAAQRAPVGPTLHYLADFTGNQRGLGTGTAVELLGIEVGEVIESHLTYDAQRHAIVTRAEFYVDPQRVDIANMPDAPGPDKRSTVERWIETLVGDGLRAQVASASFVTNFKLVSLEMTTNSPRARIERDGGEPRIPSSEAGDFAAVLQSLQGVLKNIDRATSGPQLGHALKSLDETLSRLDKATQDLEPDIKSLVKSLRETADSAQSTLGSVQGLIGSTSPAGSDLPRLVRELTQAASAVRTLADYLDRHPDALLRGRRPDDKEGNK